MWDTGQTDISIQGSAPWAEDVYNRPSYNFKTKCCLPKPTIFGRDLFRLVNILEEKNDRSHSCSINIPNH